MIHQAQKRIKNKGFTLIEILTAVVILGIISTIGVLSLTNVTDDAGEVVDKHKLSKAIRTAEEFKSLYQSTEKINEKINEAIDDEFVKFEAKAVTLLEKAVSGDAGACGDSENTTLKDIFSSSGVGDFQIAKGFPFPLFEDSDAVNGKGLGCLTLSDNMNVVSLFLLDWEDDEYVCITSELRGKSDPVGTRNEISVYEGTFTPGFNGFSLLFFVNNDSVCSISGFTSIESSSKVRTYN